jgi:hypothetical protein
VGSITCLGSSSVAASAGHGPRPGGLSFDLLTTCCERAVPHAPQDTPTETQHQPLGTLEHASRTSDERCGSRSLGNPPREDGASDGLLEDRLVEVVTASLSGDPVVVRCASRGNARCQGHSRAARKGACARGILGARRSAARAGKRPDRHPAGSAGEPPATGGRVSASPTSRHCGTKVALVSLARTSALAPPT